MIKESRIRLMKITGIVIFNLICLFSVIYVIATTVERKQAIGQEADVKVISEFQKPEKKEKPAQPKPAEVRQAEVKPAEVVPVVESAPETKPEEIQQEMQAPLPAAAPSVESAPEPSPSSVFLVDDFTGEEIKNKVGSRANVYTRAPSRIMISRHDDTINGVKKKVLMIKYDKKNTGGPNGMGGWCGYYTLIKDEKTGKYFDAASYKYVTFWVKGAKGDENFMVGVADEHWDKIGDSLKAEQIGVYLEKGKITTDWQKAKVPLDAFFLDHSTLSSVSINFEADCFPEGAGAGMVYIADIALEK
ncbi:MAG: hypothetical protein PHO42_01755 [Candidatus Omnitrophica bacterium]|nr:hypothetical protein [Candidatus Omnitrophota bacterium]